MSDAVVELGPPVDEYLGKPVDPEYLDAYLDLEGAVRRFQDAVAAVGPDNAALSDLAGMVRGLAARAEALAVDDEDRFWGRVMEEPSRGQTFTPRYELHVVSPRRAEGQVVFGAFYRSPKGAAHGGAIMALLDEACGRFMHAVGQPRVRTAFMKTDFRAVTPTEVPLDIRIDITREEGRKVFVRAELTHDGRLCAEAEGLFLHMLVGQP